jgi:hypothetical protein
MLGLMYRITLTDDHRRALRTRIRQAGRAPSMTLSLTKLTTVSWPMPNLRTTTIEPLCRLASIAFSGQWRRPTGRGCPP